MLVPCMQARLVALVAAQQLSIPMQDMEQRLEALMVMLPDLGEWCGGAECAGRRAGAGMHE